MSSAHPPHIELKPRHAVYGVISAAGIITAWVVSMVWWMSAPFGGASWALVPVAMAAQTFLYTGLFITAHDAMHRTVCWKNKRLNDLLGQLSLRLYAMFSFDKLITKHHEHHAEPASHHDPDYHDGRHPGFVRWYLTFVWRYISWRQVVVMALIFNVLSHVVGISEWRLLAFWVIPSLLSTLQLFYFGTYLPHRPPQQGWPQGEEHEHRSRSNEMPTWLSLITCYHFGYHWEHHAVPHAPWWLLPTVYRARRAQQAS